LPLPCIRVRVCVWWVDGGRKRMQLVFAGGWCPWSLRRRTQSGRDGEVRAGRCGLHPMAVVYTHGRVESRYHGLVVRESVRVQGASFKRCSGRRCARAWSCTPPSSTLSHHPLGLLGAYRVCWRPCRVYNVHPASLTHRHIASLISPLFFEPMAMIAWVWDYSNLVVETRTKYRRGSPPHDCAPLATVTIAPWSLPTSPQHRPPMGPIGEGCVCGGGGGGG
jgi:hypothetical protein